MKNGVKRNRDVKMRKKQKNGNYVNKINEGEDKKRAEKRRSSRNKNTFYPTASWQTKHGESQGERVRRIQDETGK